MYNNKKLALSIFWIVLGFVLMGLSVAEVLDSSLYAGLGGGLIAVGALQIIRNVKYRKDIDYREKVETQVRDERNHVLRMKSWSWTGCIVILVEAVGVIVFMILGQKTIQSVLSYSVCLMLCVYWISYLILSRKY